VVATSAPEHRKSVVFAERLDAGPSGAAAARPTGAAPKKGVLVNRGGTPALTSGAARSESVDGQRTHQQQPQPQPLAQSERAFTGEIVERAEPNAAAAIAESAAPAAFSSTREVRTARPTAAANAKADSDAETPPPVSKFKAAMLARKH
jgi:hypothetical protein